MTLLALLPLLIGCYEPPPLPDMAEGPATVAVTALRTAELDASLPTDLALRPDGGAWLLDGKGGLVHLDAELQPVATHRPAAAALARASRLAPADDGGVWVVDPAGFLLRVDAAGALVAEHVLETADGAPVAPVALLPRADDLLVSDRAGRILRWQPGADAAAPWASVSADEPSAAVATDLLALADGTVLAADPVGGRIVTFAADGSRGEPWGRFGHWVGALAAPKALAAGPDGTVLVADSTLDAVQVFETDGTALGALAADGALLRPDHALAVERAGDRVWILGARPAVAVALSVDAAAVDAARETLDLRRLRHRLLDADDAVATPATAEGCAACHDGLVVGRADVLRDERSHHPVDVVPEGELPAFFPLSDDGALTCGTCHSPHGTTHTGEALAVDDAEERAAVERAGGEAFLRIGLDDDALCTACHGSTAHEDALAQLGAGADAHPGGAELRDALAARGDTGDLLEAVDGGCTSCHAVHGARGPSLTRDPASAESCTGCHPAQGDPGANHAVDVVAAAGDVHPRAGAHLALGEDGTLSCASCHDLVGGGGGALLRAPDDGGLLCVACHGDRADLATGAHAKVPGSAGVPCLACHDVHGASPDATLLQRRPGSHPPVGRAGDPHACTSCHDGGPGRLGHPVTGQRVDAEHGGTLGCETCHDPHQPVLADGPTCADCHEAPAAAAEAGGHGGLVCMDCHPVHETSPMASGRGTAGDGACLSCHGPGGDAARVSTTPHPPLSVPGGERWAPLAGLALFDDAGGQVPAGEGGHLACQSCHLVHGPEEGRDNLRKGGFQEACAACHGEETLVLYRDFHDRLGGAR